MLNVNVKTCQMLIDEFVIFCYLRGPFGASFYEITLLKDKKKLPMVNMKRPACFEL